MQPWFPDAKLGIFVHYGIYAVDGVAESWSMFNGELTPEAYLKQLDGFTARNHDPNAWAELFAKAGAKYAVLTSKHHDGVALWQAPHSIYNTVENTPAARDLVTPYAEALRAHGLKVGFYFSHIDWTHPDYATVQVERDADVEPDPEVEPNPLSVPVDGGQDLERWARFRTHYHEQVEDLVARVRPDLLWFDGEWERSDGQWAARRLGDRILELNPATILNDRIRTHADYASPEQSLPFTAPDGPWELCLTVNDSWGFQHTDTNWKSARQIVRYFTETIGLGGNLLLDVGPREDGTIPAEAADRLERLGAWIAKHAEAVYATTAGLPAGHHYGSSTLSKDRRTVYLVCYDNPRESIAVRGLRNQIRRVTVLGSGRELRHSRTGGLGGHPGHLWIEAPAAEELDEYATVLAVELDGELDLYTGTGR
ncbi:alpha-L-fucosidase [Actinospica durhamensis]|uniref:alpha-L-fucosidase n=2 Tax=Actinospica durhamensis TaxID=1508375 RepID=A0A941IPV3_9ACTN|nr:alpha-L-fucosidase [Actinospica durhamensis]